MRISVPPSPASSFKWSWMWVCVASLWSYMFECTIKHTSQVWAEGAAQTRSPCIPHGNVFSHPGDTKGTPESKSCLLLYFISIQYILQHKLILVLSQQLSFGFYSWSVTKHRSLDSPASKDRNYQNLSLARITLWYPVKSLKICYDIPGINPIPSHDMECFCLRTCWVSNCYRDTIEETVISALEVWQCKQICHYKNKKIPVWWAFWSHTVTLNALLKHKSERKAGGGWCSQKGKEREAWLFTAMYEKTPKTHHWTTWKAF